MSLYKESQAFKNLVERTHDTNHVQDLNLALDDESLSHFMSDSASASDKDEEEFLEIIDGDEEDEDLEIEDEEDYDDEDLEITDEEEVFEDEPLVVIDMDDEIPELAGEGSVVVQVDDEEPSAKQFSFKLPSVPGSDSEDEIIVEEKEESVKDPFDWRARGGLKGFTEFVHDMLHNKIPRHNGRSTAGIERTLSFLQKMNKIISDAVRADLNNELDIDVIQEARDEILDGMRRLEERLKRIESSHVKKASAEESVGFIKEAQKIAGVKGIMITVPLLISRVARVCINGSVSAGHDIEDTFKKQVKAYSLNKREQAEVVQLLEDMGYPVRRDRGIMLDEDIDVSSSDNFDWSANRPA